VCTITSWTLNPSVRSSNRSEKIGDCLRFFPKLRGYGQVKQPDFCGKSTTEQVLSPEGWNTRCRPGLIRRDGVPIEVRDWGGAGYWPCPRLAPRRLTGASLRRLRCWVPIEVRDWGGAGYWPCPRLAPRRLTGASLRRLGCWVPIEMRDWGGAGCWPCPRLAPRRLTGARLRRLRCWVPIEVRDWGGAGYWPCPRLAPRRLTGARLRRLHQPLGGQSDGSPNHCAALVLNNFSIRSEDQESSDSQRFRIRPSVAPDPTKCV
jgi:hypothetical protein